MVRLILLIIISCLLTPLLSAQVPNVQIPTVYSFGRNHLKLGDVQGSPYLEFEYSKGVVSTDSDVLYIDIPLRYNCYDDVLEFQKDKIPYDLVPKSKVKRAEFGGHVFVYKDIQSGKGIDQSYLEILIEGKINLYARYTITFYDEEPLRGFADPKPARFDDFSETHYVAFNNSPAIKILTNKKLVEVLADKRKQIETFISKQKLSSKKSDDLIKIISYYNSL
jgi:hypothetical protein